MFVFFPFDQGMGAVYFNKGENCIAAGRLFVEESIHDEFVRKVVRIKLKQMCYYGTTIH